VLEVHPCLRAVAGLNHVIAGVTEDTNNECADDQVVVDHEDHVLQPLSGEAMTRSLDRGLGGRLHVTSGWARLGGVAWGGYGWGTTACTTLSGVAVRPAPEQEVALIKHPPPEFPFGGPRRLAVDELAPDRVGRRLRGHLSGHPNQRVPRRIFAAQSSLPPCPHESLPAGLATD
jgi:hypothetical protein